LIGYVTVPDDALRTVEVAVSRNWLFLQAHQSKLSLCPFHLKVETNLVSHTSCVS